MCESYTIFVVQDIVYDFCRNFEPWSELFLSNRNVIFLAVGIDASSNFDIHGNFDKSEVIFE